MKKIENIDHHKKSQKKIKTAESQRNLNFATEIWKRIFQPKKVKKWHPHRCGLSIPLKSNVIPISIFSFRDLAKKNYSKSNYSRWFFYEKKTSSQKRRQMNREKFQKRMEETIPLKKIIKFDKSALTEKKSG